MKIYNNTNNCNNNLTNFSEIFFANFGNNKRWKEYVEAKEKCSESDGSDTIKNLKNTRQIKKTCYITFFSFGMKKLKIDTIYRLNKLPININNYKTIDKYVKAINDYVYSH